MDPAEFLRRLEADSAEWAQQRQQTADKIIEEDLARKAVEREVDGFRLPVWREMCRQQHAKLLDAGYLNTDLDLVAQIVDEEGCPQLIGVACSFVPNADPRGVAHQEAWRDFGAASIKYETEVALLRSAAEVRHGLRAPYTGQAAADPDASADLTERGSEPKRIHDSAEQTHGEHASHSSEDSLVQQFNLRANKLHWGEKFAELTKLDCRLVTALLEGKDYTCKIGELCIQVWDDEEAASTRLKAALSRLNNRLCAAHLPFVVHLRGDYVVLNVA